MSHFSTMKIKISISHWLKVPNFMILSILIKHLNSNTSNIKSYFNNCKKFLKIYFISFYLSNRDFVIDRIKKIYTEQMINSPESLFILEIILRLKFPCLITESCKFVNDNGFYDFYQEITGELNRKYIQTKH